MSNDLTPYEQWMKDQLKNVDVPDMNQAWEQMSNLLQPGATHTPATHHKPWFGKWWFTGSVIVVTTVAFFAKDVFKNNTPKSAINNKTNSSTIIVSNNQKNTEPTKINGPYIVPKKLNDTLDHVKKENNTKEEISSKNKSAMENNINAKDKSVTSTTTPKNKLVVVNNNGEEKNIASDKKDKSKLTQKNTIKNIYLKSDHNVKSIKTKSTFVAKNTHKLLINIPHDNINNAYSNGIINKKDKKSISISTASSNITKASINEANNAERLQNIQYNYPNLFSPATVVVSTPQAVNNANQFASLRSTQLASSTFKKWSARVGLTFNIPFPIGGQKYEAIGFDGSDHWYLNFIPSPHINIKYTFNPKWSLSFAPQFYVQQIPYNNVLSAIIDAPVVTDPTAKLTKIVRLAIMYYSHFPVSINYNISRKFELQAGIDPAILHQAIGYENSKQEGAIYSSYSSGINTLLTKEEFQTLHKFDIRALLGITYNLKNWHFGLQFTQALSSYLKKDIAPKLSSDPVSISDRIPTKSTNASLQLFTTYDLDILKKKRNQNINVVYPKNDMTHLLIDTLQNKKVVKTRKWSVRLGPRFNVPIPVGSQKNYPISSTFGTSSVSLPDGSSETTTTNQYIYDYIPWPQLNIKYQINPKWSIEFAPLPSVQQLGANNVIYRNVSYSAPADTSISIMRLSKMFYAHLPLSVNYNINKKFELQVGVDPAIMHTALGYYESKSYRIIPPPYSFNSQYYTNVMWSGYDVNLRKFELRALLGIKYNITKNLHLGIQYTQAFSSYLKNTVSNVPLFSSDPKPSSTKNSDLNLSLKYDFDVLKIFRRKKK